MMKTIKKIAIWLGKLIDGVWIICARTVLYFLTHLLYRPKVYYQSKKSPRRRIKEPMVLTSNHLRGADGAVISVVFYWSKVHSITADKWYRKWYLRPLFECGFSVPINRSTTWLRQSVACLQKGDSVLIFPEGKAVPGKEMAPFKPGFLMLANLAGTPVLPLYMEGRYNRPFLKRLRIVVGTPYIPEAPAEGEAATSHAYLDRQSRILLEKTLELRDLLRERCQKRKKRKESL